jgi:hypothetical protein
MLWLWLVSELCDCKPCAGSRERCPTNVRNKAALLEQLIQAGGVLSSVSLHLGRSQRSNRWHSAGLAAVPAGVCLSTPEQAQTALSGGGLRKQRPLAELMPLSSCRSPRVAPEGTMPSSEGEGIRSSGAIAVGKGKAQTVSLGEALLQPASVDKQQGQPEDARVVLVAGSSQERVPGSKSAHAAADVGSTPAALDTSAFKYDHEFDLPPDQKPCCVWWDSVEVGVCSMSSCCMASQQRLACTHCWHLSTCCQGRL